MNEKYKYLGKNTLIFTISSFGTKILSFLLVPLYTSILSTAEYGIVDLITTTGTLMLYVFTINISDAVLRFSMERKEISGDILSFGYRVIFLGSIVVQGLLIVLRLLNLLQWNAVFDFFLFAYFVFTAIYQLVTSHLRAIDKVYAVGVSSVVLTLTTIISNILFLLVIKIGIYGYLISLVMGPLFGSIAAIGYSGQKVPSFFHSRIEPILRKEMFLYCIPLIFNNIALWINSYLDRYFVTIMCGIEQNGLYSIASKIPMILSVLFSIFMQAWSLSAIKEFDNNDKDIFYTSTYNIYSSFLSIMTSVLILFNVFLAGILFSNDFYLAWNYSSLLLVATLLNALTAFFGSILTAAKKTNIIAYTTILSSLINTVLNIVLIPRFGVQGACIATVTCYVALWLIRIIFVRKYCKLNINLVTNIIVFALLFGQVAMDHMENHFYIGQIIVLVIVICLNKRRLASFFKKIYKVFRQMIIKRDTR